MPTVAGLPSTVVPVAAATPPHHNSVAHLPVGFQVVGPEWGDSATMGFARQVGTVATQLATQPL
jgi:Asp-tRNA(Asn)/Glu-tRNA(Gln) amidotransferase A subunit family amidase